MTEPLKQQNRLYIASIVLLNAFVFYAFLQVEVLEHEGFVSALRDTRHLPFLGAALLLSAVFNGLLSSDTKDRLVFLRWRNALPGHRAFTQYAKKDPRVDINRLSKLCSGKFPTKPAEQNKLWYRFYKCVQDTPAVVQVHRDFLLMRDYAGLATLFVVFFGGAGIVALPSPLLYLAMLAAQFLLVRRAAATYGVRMVTTVLAETCTSRQASA